MSAFTNFDSRLPSPPNAWVLLSVCWSACGCILMFVLGLLLCYVKLCGAVLAV